VQAKRPAYPVKTGNAAPQPTGGSK
jgi:hypothetical protein